MDIIRGSFHVLSVAISRGRRRRMVVVNYEKADSGERYTVIYNTSAEFKVDFYHDRSMDVVVSVYEVN